MTTILVSGARGFIGSHLVRALAADGHTIATLRRDASSDPLVVPWDPERGVVDVEQLARVRPELVVNLAGEPIAQRWTAARRRRIRDSRVRGTTALAEALARMEHRPLALISGSAIGYYGSHRGDELLDESSAPGADFLAETARAWEGATHAAATAGIRIVHARTGIVLGKDGGVLQRVLLPFSLGVGGRLGSGDQWMSWISLEDMMRALRFAIDTTTLSGAVNFVAPNPVTNADFTEQLGRALHRPAKLPVPELALELLFGTMADNTIMASQRVAPKKLAGAGFEFQHPRLDSALAFELRRSADPAGR